MTLEITLRPPLSLSHLLRANGDDPEQEVHWVGKTRQSSQEPEKSSGRGEGPRKGKDKRGYRPLSTIKNYEVDEISNLFAPQLVRSPLDGWIARNNFCRVHLRSQVGRRPPVVFGRVKSCYPEEGHAQNVQEFELLFPNRNAEPDVVHLPAGTINFQAPQPVETYCLRVRFLFAPEEVSEFHGQEHLFLAKGLQPEIQENYLEFLEMNEQDQVSHPWLYVIGSRWLASIPDLRYDFVLGELGEMLGWGKRILNYHPDWLPREFRSLNRALKLKYRVTKHYLTEPETPKQTADLVANMFDEMFIKGLF